MTPWLSTDPVLVLGLCRRLERVQVRDAAAEVGAPVVRAKSRPMTSQPIRPTGRVTSWDSVRSVPSPSGSTSDGQTSVPGESSVVVRQAWKVATHRGSAIEMPALSVPLPGPPALRRRVVGQPPLATWPWPQMCHDPPEASSGISRGDPRGHGCVSLSSTGSGPRCLVRTPRYSPNLNLTS